jgi:hypothetical protein
MASPVAAAALGSMHGERDAGSITKKLDVGGSAGELDAGRMYGN